MYNREINANQQQCQDLHCEIAQTVTASVKTNVCHVQNCWAFYSCKKNRLKTSQTSPCCRKRINIGTKHKDIYIGGLFQGVLSMFHCRKD